MPLLNRPLTADEITRFLNTPYQSNDSFLRFMLRQIPEIVHYDGKGAPWHVPRHIFLVCNPPARSPSASVWIVPGTMGED